MTLPTPSGPVLMPVALAVGMQLQHLFGLGALLRSELLQTFER